MCFKKMYILDHPNLQYVVWSLVRISMFRPCNKLTILASTAGLLRYYGSQMQTRTFVGSNQASSEVAKILTAKWHRDTIPLHQLQNPGVSADEAVPGVHLPESGYEDGREEAEGKVQGPGF